MNIVEPMQGLIQEKYFTGMVALSPLLESDDGAPIKLYRVEFSAGARTDWHTHDGVQVLYVESGVCRVQKEDEPFQDLQPGSTCTIAAGEKHWHGATPGESMVHLAIGIYEGTDWMEPVCEVDYLGNN